MRGGRRRQDLEIEEHAAAAWAASDFFWPSTVIAALTEV